MSEAEFIRVMREYFEGLFPKVCSKCGRTYSTLRNYILTTQRVGMPIAYDAELHQWKPSHPIGGMVLANCSCGSTLSLSTESMTLSQIHDVLRWLEEQTEVRGLSASELLDQIRDKLREQVLSSPKCRIPD